MAIQPGRSLGLTMLLLAAGGCATYGHTQDGWACPARATVGDVVATGATNLSLDGQERTYWLMWETTAPKGALAAGMRFTDSHDARFPPWLSVAVQIPKPLRHATARVELRTFDSSGTGQEVVTGDSARHRPSYGFSLDEARLRALAAAGGTVHAVGLDRHGRQLFDLAIDLSALARGREGIGMVLEQARALGARYATACHATFPVVDVLVIS